MTFVKCVRPTPRYEAASAAATYRGGMVRMVVVLTWGAVLVVVCIWLLPLGSARDRGGPLVDSEYRGAGVSPGGVENGPDASGKVAKTPEACPKTVHIP